MRLITRLLCLSFVFLMISCSKKSEEKQNTHQDNIPKVEKGTEDNNSATSVPEKSVEEDIVTDLDNYFLYEEWHPVKKTDFIIRMKTRIQDIRKEDVNEELFNDEDTLEFSLHDNSGKNFCLYHNIRNVKDFDINDFEIYKFWDVRSVWCYQEKDGISVLWGDLSGAIYIFGTEDSKYATKRGIRVGSTVKDIMNAYANDSIVKEYNYEEKKFEKTQDHEGPCFILLKSNECISINQGNMVAEEMMTLSFLLTDGVVSKIVIKCTD